MITYPPRMDNLGDVNLAGLATGDLLTKDAGGNWVPITRAALLTGAGLVVNGTFEITINAGANSTANISSAESLGMDSIAAIELSETPGNPTLFTQWEITWLGGSRQACGRFLGPGVTTMIGAAPAAPVYPAFNVRVYNRSAALATLWVTWYGVGR